MSHRHGRINPIIGAGVSFLLFAPVELITGFLVHNSAIGGNAAHDAFDGIFFLCFGWIDHRLSHARAHRIYCRWRDVLSLGGALLAVVFVGVGLVIDRGNDDGLNQMLAGIVIGPISYGLNRFWHRRLHHDDHGEHHGISAHLIGDMIGAVIVFASGICAFGFGSPDINLVSGIVILVITAVVAATKARQIIQHMDHSEAEHDHRHEPVDIHRCHA